MGWLGASILTATEGWPFLQMGMSLWSRWMEVLWAGGWVLVLHNHF